MATKFVVKPPVPTRLQTSALMDMRAGIQVVRGLKETGRFYSRCDWRASHRVKAMLDEIFGENDSQNALVTAIQT